jgi:hypothetical protein
MKDQKVFNPRNILDIYSSYIDMQKYFEGKRVNYSSGIFPMVNPKISYYAKCKIIGSYKPPNSDNTILTLETDKQELIFKIFLSQKLKTFISNSGGIEAIKGKPIVIISEGMKISDTTKREYNDTFLIIEK